MFKSRNKRRRHRSDVRTPSVRRSRSRRLTIEAMESRLLLSGNQASDGDLDYAIWNLDSIQNNYAIISQGDSLPAPSPSMESTADPAGTPIDVSWVAVPGMSLSASDVRNHVAPPVIGSQLDSLGVSGLIASDFTAYVAVLPSNSPGWSNPSLNLNSTTFQYDYTSEDYTPRLLADDVRSSGDFDRDGIVNAGDYRIWRDSLDPYNIGPSDMQAYDNWKANFGVRYVIDAITGISLDVGLTVERVSLSELKFVQFDDFTATIETSASNGSLTTEVAAMFGSQGNSFGNVTTRILNLNPNELAVDALPLTGEAIAGERLVVTNNSVTIATADDADIATSGSVLVFGAGGGANPLVPSPAPIAIDAPVTPTRQSQADDDLAEAIDELLSEDVILVDHSGEVASETIVDTAPAEVIGSTEIASAGTLSDGDATIDQLAEGGMIAVEDIVGAVARGSGATVSSGTQIASDGESSDLVGELSRVAVMELIEGEAEPGTPHAAADHVSLLAASDATTNARQSTTTSGEQQPIVGRIAQVIAEQAGTAASMFAPVNPAYLATIANA
ncbi:MAG: hypothetical protein WD971_11690, partial [Pirellulales bacterium]